MHFHPFQVNAQISWQQIFQIFNKDFKLTACFCKFFLAFVAIKSIRTTRIKNKKKFIVQLHKTAEAQTQKADCQLRSFNKALITHGKNWNISKEEGEKCKVNKLISFARIFLLISFFLFLQCDRSLIVVVVLPPFYTFHLCG